MSLEAWKEREYWTGYDIGTLKKRGVPVSANLTSVYSIMGYYDAVLGNTPRYKEHNVC